MSFQNHPQKTSQGTQKRGPDTTQKQPQRPPESKKSLRRCQGQKKTNFGQPGPPSRAPKGPQIGLPSDIKSTQNHRFIRYAKNHQLWCQFRDHGLSFWKEKWRRLEYLVGDAHRHELIVNFQRMYCTVCLFLQWELFRIRKETQSAGALFHWPHIPIDEDSKKSPKKPPKGAPEPSSGTLRRTPQRPPKPITLKNHFLRRSLPRGFVVYLPLDPEMGPRLCIYIYIYACMYACMCEMWMCDVYGSVAHELSCGSVAYEDVKVSRMGA